MAPPPLSATAAAAAKAKSNGSAAGDLPLCVRPTPSPAARSSPLPVSPFPAPDYSLYPHPLVSLLHGVLTGWWLFSIVLLSSLLTNALQLLAFALLPLSRPLRLSLSQRAASLWWLLFPFSTEVWSSIPLLLTGDLPHPSDTSLFIGNHAPGLDFPTGVSIASLPPSPGTGRVMTMLKQSLAFVPTIGFTHFLQGSLFLHRDWARDRRQIAAKLDDMREGRFPRPFWIGVYPEGTRLTAEKKAESQAFSRQRGLPVFEHVLLPRTKGVTLLLAELRPVLTSVLNATTAYTRCGLYLSHPLLHGRFLSEAIHVHLTRTPIDAIPSAEAAQCRWLYAAFQEKDALLDAFAKDGRFKGDHEDGGVWEGDATRYWRLTAAFVGWSVLVSAGMGWGLGVGWGLGGLGMTALTVLRPMIVGGLFDVVGGGKGLLGSRRVGRKVG